MTNVVDGTKVAPHGLFYMENAEGREPEPVCEVGSLARVTNDHQPGCFAHEEEMGENWNGSGAAKPVLKETYPTL